MKIATIGFTEKKAERFFNLVRLSGSKTLIDVRLNNVSQLSGFAKRDDLKFFLAELCQVNYIHETDLAPTKSILDPYKKKEITWDAYADKFLNLMSQRNIERTLSKSVIENSCLLCSEHLPHQCHRRLVVEYLQQHWPDLKIEVKHLK